jgi:hypothetical protein
VFAEISDGGHLLVYSGDRIIINWEDEVNSDFFTFNVDPAGEDGAHVGFC